MRVFVTGANGQLGYDVCKRLDELGIENRGVDLADFDLTDREQVMEAVAAYHPDCVVHCAAYTAVDKAEGDRETCFAVNVEGTRSIALACQKCNSSMVCISTDYVFDGHGDQPFETDAPKAPLSIYGESKLLGENVVRELISQYFIVRTSWAFGIHGRNFVKKMLQMGAEQEKISVVCDQIGSPTYTRDLAALLCDMLQTERYGVYHATNEGFCSWYEFAREIMKLAGLSCKVTPVTTAEYASAATRPLNSRLSKQVLVDAGLAPLPTWQDALVRYFKELRGQDAWA